MLQNKNGKYSSNYKITLVLQTYLDFFNKWIFELNKFKMLKDEVTKNSKFIKV